MLNSTNIYACNQNRFTVSQLLSQQHEGRGEKKTSTAANSHLNKWNSKLWQCKNDLRTLRDINRNMVEKLSGESKSCSTHSKFGKYLHFTGIKYRYTKRSSWVPGSAGWDTILPSWTALSVLKHFPNTLLTFDTENVLKWLCVKRRYFLHKGALFGWMNTSFFHSFCRVEGSHSSLHRQSFSSFRSTLAGLFSTALSTMDSFFSSTARRDIFFISPSLSVSLAAENDQEPKASSSWSETKRESNLS